MNENQSERLVVAFERIAESLEKWYNASHPAKPEPREAKITRLKTDEELQREEQGSSNESIEDWTRLGDEIGHNERAFLSKPKK